MKLNFQAEGLDKVLAENISEVKTLTLETGELRMSVASRLRTLEVTRAVNGDLFVVTADSLEDDVLSMNGEEEAYRDLSRLVRFIKAAEVDEIVVIETEETASDD